MASFKFILNGTNRRVDVPPDTPLLWVLRDSLGLTGTKYSCGKGLCGSCTVLLDGTPVRSCIMPIEGVTGKKVLTIEGLSGDRSHPVQQAWIANEVPQCGYCQSGQILSAVALLSAHPHPTDKQIDEAMVGVLCRCGTYQRIRKAIHQAAEKGGGR